MSDGTRAVPLELVEGYGAQRPLCPSRTPAGPCFGRLHPFHVSLDLGGFQGYDSADGWVAVCVGAKPEDGFVEVDVPPCGFSMPITPRKWQIAPATGRDGDVK